MMFRRRHLSEQTDDPAVNPNRNSDLFDLTDEGYIIAHDIACQNEFMDCQCCPNCGTNLISIAQINRAFQGLNEFVAICPGCMEHYSFIFDISNDIYQEWWADRMGDSYVRTYEGIPRTPDRGQLFNLPPFEGFE